MLIVGAVGSNNVIAPFSQTPGNLCNATTGACARDYFVVAPGVGVRSSVMSGGYEYWSGTSMATPYVAGVAALVIGQSPFLTPQQVVDIILRTTTDLGAVGTDNIYGRGLVNKTAAMAPVGATYVPTPEPAPAADPAPAPTTPEERRRQGRGSSVSGVMSAGLSQSQTLRSVVLLDEYGRDYRLDLTASTGGQGMSLQGLVGEPWLRSRALAVAFDGFSITADFIEDTTPVEWLAPFAADTRESARYENVMLAISAGENVDIALGFDLAMAGRLNDADIAADGSFDGLFLSAEALNSPFAALANGGDFIGAGYRVADDVALKFGFAQSRRDAVTNDSGLAYAPNADWEAHDADVMTLSLSWEAESDLMLGVAVSRVDETGALLGGDSAGALALTDTAATTAVTVSGRYDLGEGWSLAGAFSAGVSNITPAAGSLLQSADRITSLSYGLAIAKEGVFGDDDAIGLAITRPLHAIGGKGEIAVAVDIDPDTRAITYGYETLSFAGGTPQTDYEIGYRTMLLGGDASLEFSAAYQSDVDGIAGRDAVAAMTRFGLAF